MRAQAFWIDLHLHLTLAQFVPGGSTTDPFRTIERWTAAGKGRVDSISFPASDGATLNGYIFRPPASKAGPYPGVVITTGSIQGYQEMYFWAVSGLAPLMNASYGPASRAAQPS